MTQPSPADELRAAAEKLRKHAAAASPGAWARWAARVPADVVDGEGLFVGQTARGADAKYIALMHPGVGDALAQWLDDWARPGTTEDDPRPDLHRALAVARAINGSQP